MPDEFAKHVKKLQRELTARKLDYLALVPGPNQFYFTGLQVHQSERVMLVLIPSRGQALVLAPVLEVPRIESRLQIPARIFGWRDEEGSHAAWKEITKAKALDKTKIAVEYLAMRVMELSELRANAKGVRTVDAGEMLAKLRMTKDAAEIDAMRRAAHVLDSSLEEVLSEIRVGMTENEIATMWQYAMKAHGADQIPEAPIIASGPNSANPHTTATDRNLERGDFVVFDGWCQVDGYFGDMTRTVVMGEPTEEQRKIYDTVLKANRAGVQAVRKGLACEEVDRAARDVIERAGYGKYFLHRTGHGLGIEVHEPPFMVEGYKTKLEAGMTFTVEPGIYVAGQVGDPVKGLRHGGGVRIEDDIVVTQDGVETLTGMDRELRVIGN